MVIQNEKGEILIGKRTGSHAPLYSIPGGHLEQGETFEEAAIKEVREETGLIISNPKVFVSPITFRHIHRNINIMSLLIYLPAIL